MSESERVYPPPPRPFSPRSYRLADIDSVFTDALALVRCPSAPLPPYIAPASGVDSPHPPTSPPRFRFNKVPAPLLTCGVALRPALLLFLSERV